MNIKTTSQMTLEEKLSYMNEIMRTHFTEWDGPKLINYLMRRGCVTVAELMSLTGLSYIEIEMIRFPDDYEINRRDIELDHIVAVMVALRAPSMFSERVIHRFGYQLNDSADRDETLQFFLYHCSEFDNITVLSCNDILLNDGHMPLTPLVPKGWIYDKNTKNAILESK